MTTAALRSPTTNGRVTLDVHAHDLRGAMADDVRRGLLATPKVLLPKYFYDGAGSELFEQITRLPEYYQTRTELQILREAAAGIVARHRPTELVELGSGSSRKTVTLLDAMHHAGLLVRFIPFDVDPGSLRDAAGRLAQRYPELAIHAVAGDFECDLATIPTHAAGARRIVAFLGGTIGNLLPAERRPFLRTLRSLLAPGDCLLVGVDLVKDVAVLEAAYDDAAGVTAAFNRNVLSVINRELDADFAPERFAHVACYDPARAWIEMRLRATVAQTVRVDALGLSVRFAQGEEMRTEVSCKFTRASLEAALTTSGLQLLEFHTDPECRFAVAIAGRDERD